MLEFLAQQGLELQAQEIQDQLGGAQAFCHLDLDEHKVQCTLRLLYLHQKVAGASIHIPVRNYYLVL